MHRYFANNHEMENVNQLIVNDRDDTAKKRFFLHTHFIVQFNLEVGSL